MARTFRRKNWFAAQNTSWNKQHSTVAAFREFDRVVCIGNGHGGYSVYRPMTPQEAAAWYWAIHGESKSNSSWGPDPFFKKLSSRRRRQAVARDIRQVLAGDDGLFFENDPSYREFW